jgi:hypothetical protein
MKSFESSISNNCTRIQIGVIALGISGTLLRIILCAPDSGYNAVAYGSWAATLAILWSSIENILIDKCKEPDPALREQSQA